MFRLVFLSWLQFVQCLCILFLFYLTVLFACMMFLYYNMCDCHAFRLSGERESCGHLEKCIALSDVYDYNADALCFVLVNKN